MTRRPPVSTLFPYSTLFRSDITLIYESGTIGTAPDVLPLSIGDGELCDTAVTTVSVPEMFRYWLQGGRISIGDRKSTRLNSSHLVSSYAVFCLKRKRS